MSITRREFVEITVLLSGAVPRSTQAGRLSELRVNSSRLRERLEALSVYGRPSGGTFVDGVSRPGYSDADVAARHYVMGLMKAADVNLRIDTAGNIFAGRGGQDSNTAPVLFGSHIDTVPNAGNFDGNLGSLAAIEVLQVLYENGITTLRPLEAVVWSCEEATFGNLNGSRAAAGKLPPAELDRVAHGIKLSDAIRRIGGDPDRLSDAQLRPGSIHAYLELHIEQGDVLDREGTPIGVVEGIVSIDHYTVTVRGFANHAGTTPMANRQDALIAASQLTLAVREVVTSEPGSQVGTVGQLEVEPNAPNVIPGKVHLTVELRHLSTARLERLAKKIQERAAEIAAQTDTHITFTLTDHVDPALTAPEMQALIESVATNLGLKFRRLPSGAGHDAQMMAPFCPIGMIFVPSISGVSHSPKELTSWEDCTRGANVLLHSVLAAAGGGNMSNEV